MKKILTILLMLSALPAVAQQMLVDKNIGENEIVDLENLRQITFNGANVNIEQTDGATSSSSMSAINQITFGDYTAIGDVKDSCEELITYISSDEIAVNCAAGSTVTIYSIVGTQVLNVRLGSDYGRISIASLPKGIYIVKAQERTAKIVRR